ncbi:hypothetical protein EPUL_004553, partial [Erysiphe pulchra]
IHFEKWYLEASKPSNANLEITEKNQSAAKGVSDDEYLNFLSSKTNQNTHITTATATNQTLPKNPNIDIDVIHKLIKQSIDNALESYSLPKKEPLSNQTTPSCTNNYPSNQSQFRHQHETHTPQIAKYSGKTNVNQYIEDLEARFILPPYSHASDRIKVIFALENLCGAEDNVTSDAPKEWAGLEFIVSPESLYTPLEVGHLVPVSILFSVLMNPITSFFVFPLHLS